MYSEMKPRLEILKIQWLSLYNFLDFLRLDDQITENTFKSMENNLMSFKQFTEEPDDEPQKTTTSASRSLNIDVVVDCGYPVTLESHEENGKITIYVREIPKKHTNGTSAS